MLVRRDIISKFVLWILAPKIDMLLKMMKVAILWAICKPCCSIRFTMPEVTFCPENIVIPTLGIGIVFKGKRLEDLPEYFVKHLSGCLQLLIQLHRRNIAVLDWN